MRRIVLFVVLLAALVAMGIVYRQHRVEASEHQARLDRITQSVRAATVRLEDGLKHLVAHDSTTYDELFSKIDSHISEISETLLAIKIDGTPDTEEAIKQAETYITECISLLRAERTYFKAELERDAQLDLAREYVDRPASADGRNSFDAINVATEALDGSRKARAQQVQAASEFEQRAGVCRETVTHVSLSLPSSSLLNLPLLDQATASIAEILRAKKP
ncbi:MAG: hypothetical protein ACT4QA_07830 [Panacagrimonas sp.]